MSKSEPYAIDTEVRFQPLEVVDIAAVVAQCVGDWHNFTLCEVNDSVIRLGVIKGEFHWHQHDREDEFFYVVAGRLLIDLPDATVELAPQQGFTVPRGMQHRTRAPETATILMVEAATVTATGD